MPRLQRTQAEKREIADAEELGMRPCVRCESCRNKRLCSKGGDGRYYCPECKPRVPKFLGAKTAVGGKGDGHVIRSPKSLGG